MFTTDLRHLCSGDGAARGPVGSSCPWTDSTAPDCQHKGFQKYGLPFPALAAVRDMSGKTK